MSVDALVTDTVALQVKCGYFQIIKRLLLATQFHSLLFGHISKVQFSPLTDWVVGETGGTIQQRSSSRLFCSRLL